MNASSIGTDRDIGELISELRAVLSGAVIAAGDAEYEQARKVWNGMYDDREPLAVLRCADEQDVSRAVVVLAGVDAPLAIRGGGHHIAGFGGCDGGFVLDLRNLRTADVDVDARRVRVGGGALLHDLDTASAAHGLAVPVGVVSETGVAGLTLSGGVGWQTRKRGYACDNLRRCRVVTASGEIVEASEDENPDLLWGLRGGGGNFGVVTEFDFDAYPQDQVVVASANHRVEGADDIAELLHGYREWARGASHDHTAWILIGRGDDEYLNFLPELRGERTVALAACTLDTSAEGVGYAEKIMDIGAPALTQTLPMRMLELQHFNDVGDPAIAGMPRYMKGEMMRELTDEVIAGIASRTAEMPTNRSAYEMGTQGGRMGEIDEMAMAVGMRDAKFLGGFSIMGDVAGENIDHAIEWAREAWQVLQPTSCGGTYLNFDNEADEGRVLGSLSAARGDEKREKLASIKRAWDPNNRFYVNHNIKPSA